MNKRNNILLVLLVIMCCALSVLLVTNRLSYSSKVESCRSNKDMVVDNSQGDFSLINKDVKLFDVSDLAEVKESTIDIASKEYVNNVISILDTDYKISDELAGRIYSTIN